MEWIANSIKGNVHLILGDERIVHGTVSDHQLGDIGASNGNIHTRHLSLVPNCPFYRATCAVTILSVSGNLIGCFSFDDFLFAMIIGEIRWADARMVSL